MGVAPESIIKELKQNVFRPIYFLHGDEPYYIDQITEILETRVVPDSEKGFNQFVIYGKDSDIAGVLSNARRFPFMADRQLVLVKEAQKLGGMEQKEQQARLVDYANNPLTSTILVFCFQSMADERKQHIKAIGGKGVVVQSKKMYDNKLPDWCTAFCHDSGIKISPKAVQMIVDFIGNDLKRISNEIRKITINLQAGESIDAGTVERFIGISKEYNVFEFQKALQQRDVLKANRIVQYFTGNPKDNPLPPILTILFGFFSKVLMAHASPDKGEKTLAELLSVNPFFVKDYLAALRNYDLSKTINIIGYLRHADSQVKGVEAGSTNEGEILRELVFKILH